VQLRAEEMNPEIPVHWDPQEALAHSDENGRKRTENPLTVSRPILFHR
jgi:hypothetical protein